MSFMPLDQGAALVGIPVLFGVLGRLFGYLLVRWGEKRERARAEQRTAEPGC